MKHKDYQSICEQVIPLAKSTGSFIKNELQKVETTQIIAKEANSLVSYVDKTAEEMLVEGLSKILPEAGFITEESTTIQNQKSITWVVDPLDGTNNFLHGIPHFAISIGCMIDGQTMIGLVENVYYGETFYAWKGGGAFLDGNPIRVSTTTSLAGSIIATGFPYDRSLVPSLLKVLGRLLKKVRGVRRFGAAALDLVNVAAGRLEGYYETTLNAWDVTAGALIVEEAGGKVTDYEGEENFIFGGNIIATNAQIHNQLLQILKSDGDQ